MFIKVYCAHPELVKRIKRVFEVGIPSIFSTEKYSLSPQSYEAGSLPFELRFMIDKDFVGMSWVRIAAGNWTLRRESDKASSCQIEFDVENYNDLIAVPSEGVFSKIAPIRILSFDLEC